MAAIGSQILPTKGPFQGVAEHSSKATQPDQEIATEKRKLLRYAVDRTNMHIELKQRAERVERAKVVPVSPTKVQSDIHFKAMMGPEYNSNLTAEEKVALFFEKHEILFKESDVTVTKAQQRIFCEMLQQEALHSKSVAFYHGTSNVVGFANDVASEFRRQLELHSTVDYQALRPFDDIFSDNMTISRLMDIYAGNDLSRGFQACGISTNIFPFGSHTQRYEATYHYFLANFTQEPPQKLLHDFLKRLRIDIDPKAFQAIYDQYICDSGGVCYQIFIDPEHIDHVAAPARENGGKNSLRKDGARLGEFSKVLQEIKEDPQKNAEYIQTVQARLYLDPTILQHAHIKTYRAKPLTPEQHHRYMTAIRELVERCVIDRLERSIYFPMKAFKGTSGRPRLVKQLQMLDESGNFNEYGLMTEDPDDWVVKIARLIEGDRTDDLVQLMIDTPTLDLRKTYDDAGLPGIPEIGVVSELYKGPIALAVYRALQGYRSKHRHLEEACQHIQEEALMQCVRLGDIEEAVRLFALEHHKDTTSTDPTIIKIKELLGENARIEIIIAHAAVIAIEHNQSKMLVWFLKKCEALGLEKPYIGKETIAQAIEKEHFDILKLALDHGLSIEPKQSAVINERTQ